MYSSARNNSSGFTLIELMIVLALVALVAGLLIPGFTSYIKNQAKHQALEQVKSDLRTIQNRALTGVSASDSVNYWGVKFISKTSQYYYFTSAEATDAVCTGITSANTEHSAPLPQSVVIWGTGCIFFSFANGDASYALFPDEAYFEPNVLWVRLGYPTGIADCNAVEINNFGNIQSVLTDTNCSIF